MTITHRPRAINEHHLPPPCPANVYSINVTPRSHQANLTKLQWVDMRGNEGIDRLPDGLGMVLVKHPWRD